MMLLLILMSGLMAGIYFTFSVFVMRALGELPAEQGAAAMNRINTVIVSTLFMPIFFLSSLGFAGLMIWSLLHWQTGQSGIIVLAALVYLLGMFAVTAFGNVPLNNHLQASADHEDKLAASWQTYQRDWTRLNHIRTLSCIVACALLIHAVN